MDEALLEQIHRLAEENGLDPQELEALLGSGEIPDELMAAIVGVLGDVTLFAEALGKLDE